VDGKTQGLGFSQPVAREQLTPVELLPLVHGSEDDRTKILLANGSEWEEFEIEGQTIDGKIYIRQNAGMPSKCIDLTKENYRWA
jgi:hypothetical protein